MPPSPAPAPDRVSRSAFMDFRELSLAAQIAAILAVYGIYTEHLWGLWHLPLAPLRAVSILIGITILMISISIAAHIAIMLYVKPERHDERDRIVMLRGKSNAYRALAAAVWCVILLVIAGKPSGLTFCALMGAFAVSELARLGSQLYYYRFGA